MSLDFMNLKFFSNLNGYVIPLMLKGVGISAICSNIWVTLFFDKKNPNNDQDTFYKKDSISLRWH